MRPWRDEKKEAGRGPALMRSGVRDSGGKKKRPGSASAHLPAAPASPAPSGPSALPADTAPTGTTSGSGAWSRGPRRLHGALAVHLDHLTFLRLSFASPFHLYFTTRRKPRGRRTPSWSGTPPPLPWVVGTPPPGAKGGSAPSGLRLDTAAGGEPAGSPPAGASRLGRLRAGKLPGASDGVTPTMSRWTLGSKRPDREALLGADRRRTEGVSYASEGWQPEVLRTRRRVGRRGPRGCRRHWRSRRLPPPPACR
jgi:hypothetical protein